jgi:O-antigen/teichoic acid export membrane protein
MHDFFGANTLRAGTVLLVFVSLLMLQVSGSVTPYLAALCYSLSFLPVTAWLAIRLWRVMPPTLNGIRGSLRVVSHYAFRCYPLDLIGTSAFYASQVAVVTLLDPAIVGLFFVAFGVARIMEVTYTAVATVLLPKTAGLGSAEVVEKTMRAARLNLLGSIPITLILILLAGFLLPLLYGDDFAAAVLLARVMLVEALVTGTTSILAQAFLALGRPRIPTLLNIIGLAASIIGMVMLVPSLGAMGVVVTMLLVACLKLATIVTSYRKLLGVPLRRFLIQREDMDFLRRLSGRLRPGTTR